MTALNKQVEDIDPPIDGEAAGQYLTFMLAGEEYGVEILKVQEIKGWDTATPIPNTPEHVLGVLNLRGAVVPIIDLRKRFDLEKMVYGPTTVVIVVKMNHEDQERTVGLVVDAVADVYRLEGNDIQPAPEMGAAVKTEYIRGLATVENKMVILLEIDKLVDFNSMDSNGVHPAEKVAAGAESETALAQ
ncbi:MAG: chemotaxis protein CheW [Acidiferrobacterales bacterium]|nr:chemotaxis protein CheW [Acidiferrobacterales bacterium]